MMLYISFTVIKVNDRESTNLFQWIHQVEHWPVAHDLHFLRFKEEVVEISRVPWSPGKDSNYDNLFSDCISWNYSPIVNLASCDWNWFDHLQILSWNVLVEFYQRGSCHAIHLGLDLFGLFQKTAKLGDGYDNRNEKDKPFSFTEKETFSGVTILTASEVCIDRRILCSLLDIY